MRIFEPLHIVYDGHCLFCIRSLKLFRAVDFMQVFQYYDAHDKSRISKEFPELRDADFDHAMFIVTESRKVSRRFFAFRRMIWSSPLTWFLIPIFYFPGAVSVGTRVYAWVAKNRLRFGCRSDTCTLPSLSSKDPL